MVLTVFAQFTIIYRVVLLFCLSYSYNRCVKAPGSKNSIGTLQKPCLSECLPILARKQPTNLADEETSSFSTAVGVRQNDISNYLVTDMQEVTQLEGLSTENLPDLQTKLHRYRFQYLQYTLVTTQVYPKL